MTRKLAALAAGLLAATGLTIASAAPAAATITNIEPIIEGSGQDFELVSVEELPGAGIIQRGDLPVDVNPGDYSMKAVDGTGDIVNSRQENVKYVFGTSWKFGNGAEIPNNTHAAFGTLVFNLELTGMDHTGVSITICSVAWTGSDGNYECTGDEIETVQIISGTFGSSGPSGPAGSGTSAGGSLPTYLQQFVESPNMTCDEAQPEGLNWSGAPSGGWGESWAQWPNDGQGGNVCSRTLFYNNSTGMWDVR